MLMQRQRLGLVARDGKDLEDGGVESGTGGIHIGG